MYGDDFQADLQGRETSVAEVNGRVVGWTSAGWKDGTWWMDDLWILPAFMRRGIGSALFDRVARRGRELGASRMEWETDPGAVGFYERMGAHAVGEREPTPPSPSLPIYALPLAEPAS